MELNTTIATAASLRRAAEHLAGAADMFATGQSDVVGAKVLLESLNGASSELYGSISPLFRVAPDQGKLIHEVSRSAANTSFAAGSVFSGMQTALSVKESGIASGAKVKEALESAGLLHVKLPTAMAPTIRSAAESALKGAELLEGRASEAMIKAVHVPSVDPIGRDRDVAHLMTVLSNNKGSVALIGEPGTGRMALVEGLAKRIIDGRVPPNLKDRPVLSIDFDLLHSGITQHGEYEARVKSMIGEAAADGIRPIIVFDAERAISRPAGVTGPEFTDLVRPYIRDGKINAVAIMPEKIKKDMLEARGLGDLMQVQNPSTINDHQLEAVLETHRARIELEQGIEISDEAINTAARLSSNYLGRGGTGEAVKLLENAAAFSRTSLELSPRRVTQLEEKAASLRSEIAEIANSTDEILVREREVFEEDLARITDELDALNARWNKERALVAERLDISSQMGIRGSGSGADSPELVGRAGAIDQELAALRGEHEPLASHVVTDQNVSEALELLHGIPVARQSSENATKLANFETEVGKMVKGQDEAIASIGKSLRAWQKGLTDPNRSMGAFFLDGTSGSGKTELANSIARYLFDDPNALLRIDGSEYTNLEMATTKLLGAGNGYKGESGVITSFLERHPNGVILFDEVDKMDPEVLNLLLQGVDAGRMTSGTGKTYDTRGIIFMVTANKTAKDLLAMPAGTVLDELRKKELRNVLTQHFRPETIGRFDDVLYFRPSTVDNLTEILAKEASRRIDGVRARTGARLRIDPAAYSHIAKANHDPAVGARPALRELSRQLGQALENAPLENGTVVHVKLDPEKGILFVP